MAVYTSKDLLSRLSSKIPTPFGLCFTFHSNTDPQIGLAAASFAALVKRVPWSGWKVWAKAQLTKHSVKQSQAAIGEKKETKVFKRQSPAVVLFAVAHLSVMQCFEHLLTLARQAFVQNRSLNEVSPVPEKMMTWVIRLIKTYEKLSQDYVQLRSHTVEVPWAYCASFATNKDLVCSDLQGTTKPHLALQTKHKLPIFPSNHERYAYITYNLLLWTPAISKSFDASSLPSEQPNIFVWRDLLQGLLLRGSRAPSSLDITCGALNLCAVKQVWRCFRLTSLGSGGLHKNLNNIIPAVL